MNNHVTPPPGTDCPRFADILPVLADRDDALAAEARQHLAGCAYCQAQQRAYVRLEAALRRTFGPAATPHIPTEDIMASLPNDDATPVAPRSVTPSRNSPTPVLARTSRWLAVALAFAVVVGLSAVFAATHRPVSRPASSSSIVDCEEIGNITVTTDQELASIAMLSPSEGWAVGSNDYVPSPIPEGAIYHYTNGRWSQFGALWKSAIFTSIAMHSPTDGWATGSLGTYSSNASQALVLHYDGQRWSPISIPNASQFFIRRVGIAPDGGVWLLANKGAYSLGTYLLAFHNGTWQVLPFTSLETARQTALADHMAVVSSDDIWVSGAIMPTPPGGSGIATAFFAHYLHGRWTSTTFQGQIIDFTMLSATNGWAVGNVPNTHQIYANLFHYDGTAWRVVALPANLSSGDASFESIGSTPDGELWLLGTTGGNGNFTRSSGGDYQHSTFIAHQVAGQWQISAEPYQPPQQQLALVPQEIMPVSSNDVWVIAVMPILASCKGGEAIISIEAVFLHDNNGVWSKETVPLSTP